MLNGHPTFQGFESLVGLTAATWHRRSTSSAPLHSKVQLDTTNFSALQRKATREIQRHTDPIEQTICLYVKLVKRSGNICHHSSVVDWNWVNYIPQLVLLTVLPIQTEFLGWSLHDSLYLLGQISMYIYSIHIIIHMQYNSSKLNI